jgi:hypothetical protein
VELLEPRQLILMRRDNDFPATFIGDAPLDAVCVHGLAALHAESRFQRPGRVVDACVNNSAVMPALVRRDLRLLLQHEDPQTLMAEKRLSGNGEPDNARADNHEVGRSVRTGAAQRLLDSRVGLRQKGL